MYLTKLYAELQLNPRCKVAYRKILEHYQQLGMSNEAKAFEELIEKKFHADSSNTDEKQRENHRIDT